MALKLLTNNHYDREHFFLTEPLYSYIANPATLHVIDGVWHIRERVPTTIPDNQANKIHPAGRLV
jgi:hypothetical protein